MDIGVFEQIAFVLAVCVAAAGIATLLRQPIVVGLIAAGVAVGPSVLGIVGASSEIDLLATVGTSLLLFVVGLKLDVRILRRLGTVAFSAGLGQIGFTAVLGYALAVLLGFSAVNALYLSIALTFSSTVIVVKLLTDKRQLHSLHGQISLGILVVQDLVVIVVMLAITAVGDIGSLQAPGLLDRIGGVLLRAALLVTLVLVMGRLVAPRLTGVFERQGELLVLAVVTWSVLLAALSVQLGFSAEIGAFLAGVALASTRYRDAVASRLATLRDFVLVFFFVQLGTRVDPTTVAEQWPAILVLSLFVLVGNPIIVMTVMGSLGYRRRVAFKTGLHLAQISEFSLILVALGVAQGHVGPDLLGVVTVIGAVTIAASTELIHNADRLHRRLDRVLRVFERGRPTQLSEPRIAEDRPEYVIIGVGRLGTAVLDDLLARGDRALGVDFDPRGIKRTRWQLPVIYGDADDPDLPAQLPLHETRWVIITVRDLPADLHLIRALREHGYARGIAVAADHPDDCARLQEAGADVTLRPLQLAAGPLLDAVLDEGGTA
ncbi:MAG: cation:proton antiporter [Nitriliruptoraceae bacterium]